MHRKIQCPECGAYNRSNRRTCRCCGRVLPNRRVFVISMALCLCFIAIVVCVSLVPSKSLDDLMEENRIIKTELLSKQIEFGISKEDLIRAEDLLYYYDRDSSDNTQEVTYYIKFGDIPGKVTCYFTQNRGLICIIYYFFDYEQNHEELKVSYDEFISDYYFIEDYLTDKYGYQEIQYEWYDNSYEQNEPNLAQAISDKKLDLCTYRYSNNGYYVEHWGTSMGYSFQQCVFLHTGTYYYDYQFIKIYFITPTTIHITKGEIANECIHLSWTSLE